MDREGREMEGAKEGRVRDREGERKRDREANRQAGRNAEGEKATEFTKENQARKITKSQDSFPASKRKKRRQLATARQRDPWRLDIQLLF